jgi:GntR family histidine utilization transcriptional repressor
VPSENELCELCDVSRMTARRALEEMTQDGVLYRVQGRGTFVSPPKMQASFIEIRNIADEIRALGQTYTNDVRLLTAEPCPEPLRELFGLNEHDKVFHSIIVHCEHTLPVQLEDRYVNPRCVPDYLKQDFRHDTPNVYLSQIAPLTAAEHIIEAQTPDLRLKRLLQMNEHEACLVVTRTTWSGSNAISFAKLYHPGSRYRIAGKINGKN